ncbi:hypothetical protein SSYM_1327, partial [Serratia symbiotica str. Tucson]
GQAQNELIDILEGIVSLVD